MLGEDLHNILAVVRECGKALHDRANAGEAAYIEFNEAATRASRVAYRLMSAHTLSFRDRQPIDIDIAVAAFSDMIQRAIGDQIHLSLNLAASQTYVLAGRDEIERILLNLAVNGRRAMADGGVLTIRTGVVKEAPPGLRFPHVRATSQVRLMVADTGAGLLSGARHRVLGPTPLRKEHGTQLTLAAVAHTVRTLGGDLRIEADDGQGTRVVIDLPGVDSSETD